MNFKIIIIISIFGLSFSLTSCQLNKLTTEISSKEEGERIHFDKTNQLQYPPELYIVYNDVVYQGVKGTYSWGYISTDGQHVIPAIEADSGPPNELVEYQEDEIMAGGKDTIEIFFETAPDKCSIQVWDDDEHTKPVEYTDESKNYIIVPNDSDKVIYSVHAFWEQGNAYYAFEVIINN